MKKSLPTYSIGTLGDEPVSKKEFVADHFAHYLDAHRNLHFPHKHSFYQVVFFSKGSGQHSIDFIHFPVVPGQIYFMIPGQVHTWDFKGMPDGFIVNFSQDYLQTLIADSGYLENFSFFSGNATEQVLEIPKSNRKEIAGVFELIIKEGGSGLPLRNDMVRTALVQLFIHISRLTGMKKREKQINSNSLILRNFRQLIEKHFKEKKLPKEYAAMLFITPNHLNALCKSVTGKPAGEIIRDRILLEAKRLLTTDMFIAGISSELGFADNSYFTRFFRKHEGIAPEAFRKQFIKQTTWRQ